MSVSPESKHVPRDRILYFDLLRVVATIGVIVIHVSATKWYSVEVHSFDWQVFNVYDSLVRWSVPIFLMISGALFLDPARRISQKNLFSKNVVRIICAFVFWSFIYVLFNCMVTHDIKSLQDAIVQFVRGKYHMWFLYTIVGLYIITPLLRRITADWSMTRYFVIVSLVFSFFLPTFFEFANTFKPLIDSESWNLFLSTLTAAYSKVHYHFTLEYVSYFVLGYYLSKLIVSKHNLYIVSIIGTIAFISTIIFTSWISIVNEKGYEGFYGNMTLMTLAESVLIFVLIKNHCNSQTRDREGTALGWRLVEFVSARSFGIYLVHVMIIEIVTRIIGFSTISINPVVSIPLITCIVFTVSLGVSTICHAIPRAGKYIT